MIVLGVDPGTIVAGYAFLEQLSGRIRVLEYGVIRCDPKKPMPERLGKIFSDLLSLMKTYQPDSLAIEDVFFSKFPRSALALGHARGAIMAAAHSQTVPVCEYAPRLVKQAVSGKGSASKQQVGFMMCKHLMLREMPRQEDATDALAVAFCHLMRNPAVMKTSPKTIRPVKKEKAA